MCDLLAKISVVIADFIPSFFTILGVIITVHYSRKDVDRELQALEKSHKETLRASVKPILYPLKKSSICEMAVSFKAKDVYSNTIILSAHIKNTNNGIAIIKKITLGNVDYYPETDCVIDKGVAIKINIFGLDKTVTTNGIIDVYDIFNNSYCYPFTLFYDFFAFNCSESIDNSEQIKKSYTVKTNNINKSTLLIGDNNTINK